MLKFSKLQVFKNVRYMKRTKLHYLIFLSVSLVTFNALAQKTLAEKLGYQANAKLLIIHADDVGVSHSENRGSMIAMKIGMVTSASIMMPCPWVSEVASYIKENPTKDFGLHLTLTSEWETMKWSPVASKDTVKSLVNDQGLFYAGCQDFEKNAKIEEVEIELRAQIELAYKMGIKPSHLDSHMGCLVYNPKFLQLYLKLGAEYKIPVMIDKAFYAAASAQTKSLVTNKDLLLEKVITANPTDFEGGMANYYEKVLKNLTPGVQIVLIHTAFNDSEMQALTINHPNWGAKWRQDDFNFFTSERCRKILEDQNIKLVTWRQIQKIIYKN
jgi:predicted glycoside hydrolase/deacetylase ChbG (UPF0249 family)